MKNAKIIAVANHKGGVGKTTTVACLGSILAMKGKRVLLIDLDAQANLTTCFLAEEPETTMYDALVGNIASIPLVEVRPNLTLAPSCLSLSSAEMQLSSKMARETILRKLLTRAVADDTPLSNCFDYILIDTPPSLDILVLNALAACDEVVIPTTAEVLPSHGLVSIKNFIDQVREYVNPGITLRGIVITRWERSRLSQDISEQLRAAVGDLLLGQKIRKNIRLAEVPGEKKNIIETAPTCNGAKDYQLLAAELFPGLFTAVEIKEITDKKSA